MNRYFYADTIENFVKSNPNYILGTLIRNSPFDITDLQRNAWEEEINLLSSILQNDKGQIIFEYDIPRLGKRIDVVLLISGIVYALEFKVNSTEYLRQNIEQVWDYALDLKNFHEASHNLTIVPILIATNAKNSSKVKQFSHYDDLVFEPILCNAREINNVIQKMKAQHAINIDLNNWNVFISDKLQDKEYATGEIDKLLENNSHVRKKSDLHLAVSMRSFRAEQLSEFVHALLASDVDEAKRLYESLKDRYPIVLTRSLDNAKAWLKQQKRGSERYGMLVSSQAQRLRPLSIDVRCKPDTVHWFLDDIDDIRSSLFLEDAASEFDVQGLELDWTCIVWDGDLRRENNTWGNYSFTGNKWQNIRSEERKSYQINAYRVLLTRARQGMIICVPKGNPEDGTRNPAYYDGTFNYLRSIGLEVI